MTPWSLLLPGFASGLDGLSWPGTLADRLVFTVLFCALVDFVKLLIELLGRAEDREFESDPSLVTVVSACRNGAGVLASTIEDIRRIAPGAQVMVVDDGSTDGTANLARELGCEVHRFERSKGKAAAVNYGIYRVATPLASGSSYSIGATRPPLRVSATPARSCAASGGGSTRSTRSPRKRAGGRSRSPSSPALTSTKVPAASSTKTMSGSAAMSALP